MPACVHMVRFSFLTLSIVIRWPIYILWILYIRPPSLVSSISSESLGVLTVVYPTTFDFLWFFFIIIACDLIWLNWQVVSGRQLIFGLLPLFSLSLLAGFCYFSCCISDLGDDSGCGIRTKDALACCIGGDMDYFSFPVLKYVARLKAMSRDFLFRWLFIRGIIVNYWNFLYYT